LVPWETPAGPVPPYPVASNMADLGGGPQPRHAVGAGLTGHEQQAGGPAYGGLDTHALRDLIRQLVVEELAQFAGESRG
jgi:hypothetical protein